MPEATHSTQVTVIGAGPGGYVAAIRLAQLGRQVTVVEKEALGGVCLNWGCIPSKALIHAATLYEKIQHADEMGILVSDVAVDLNKLQAWKNGVVKKLTGGIGHLLKANGVTVLSGKATFTGAHTLLVTDASGNQTHLQTEQVLIATGSSTIHIPGFELDGTLVLDSRDALDLVRVPENLAVIGGGVIGLEIGVLYAKLGSTVTVIEMTDQLLPGTDAEIVQMLARLLKKRGITVLTGAKASKLEKSGPQAGILTAETAKGPQSIPVDAVLVSVGRKPNTQGLGLEVAGVAVTERGFIPVDKRGQTNVPHIYAIGDVTGGALLAHKASKEGLIAAAAMSGSSEEADYQAMPAAIFTDPEIASVGLTEAQAVEKGYAIKVGKFPFQASGRALSMNEPDGMVKVISHAETDEILGVHMIGPAVSELIAEAALAIELGATVEDLTLTVHAHPTLPESLMEAAEAVHGKAIHIYQGEKKADKRPEKKAVPV